MKQPFINEAFTKAINDYVESQNNKVGVVYNSFLVVVIRLLVNIYSELDIVGPFMMDSVETLKRNLMKFGYPEARINSFFVNLQQYYDLEKENASLGVKRKENRYFVELQKQIIDMMIAKKMSYHLTDLETKEFYNMLYTPNATNPLLISYNYLMASNVLEVDEYYKKQMTDNVKMEEVKQKRFLNLRAYEILGHNLESINAMSADDLDKVNTVVYEFFKIKENAINREYLLEKAIEDYDRSHNRLTSGNGYVDILLVMSIIVTVIMLIGVVVVSI